MSTVQATTTPTQTLRERTSYAVLVMISFCHFLNDMIQSLLPAIYPILKGNFHLDFAQVGMITFTNQLTASVLQPVVGSYTDKRPQPFSLSIGMGCTLIGLIVLSLASSFPIILAAAAMIGIGSSVFHPESSRVARMASGGQHGFAQSIFQVGGNAGSATGPLLAAFIVLPHGQGSLAWFSLAALLGMALLGKVGMWAKAYRAARAKVAKRAADHAGHGLSSKQVNWSIAILVGLIFSKYIYMASLTSYYTFYLISKFHLPVRNAQVYLFVFLGAVALGTILGGPIGDRVGRKYVIWCSILGVLPFTLAAPLREPVLDRNLQRHHRHDPGVRLPRDRRLRARTAPRQTRHDLRIVLRPSLRHRRHRRGVIRATSRSHQHRFRISRRVLHAPARIAGRFPSRYRRRHAPHKIAQYLIPRDSATSRFQPPSSA